MERRLLPPNHVDFTKEFRVWADVSDTRPYQGQEPVFLTVHNGGDEEYGTPCPSLRKPRKFQSPSVVL
jgi:hypothetical protein